MFSSFKKIIIIAVLILIMGFWAAAFKNKLDGNRVAAEPITNIAARVSQNIRIKEDAGEGEVTVRAEISKIEEKLSFNISLDTHSVDLSSFDPNTQIKLAPDNGDFFGPQFVEQAGSDHHRGFTVKFSSVQGGARLIILNLAGVAQRELIWTAEELNML